MRNTVMSSGEMLKTGHVKEILKEGEIWKIKVLYYQIIWEAELAMW